MPVPAAPRPRATSHHGSRRRTGVIASFREPIPGWEAKGDNTRKKPVRHWTYWTHGEQPRAQYRSHRIDGSTNQARASAEPRAERPPRPSQTSDEAVLVQRSRTSIERRASEPAPVERARSPPRLGFAAPLRRWAARVHAAAAKTRGAQTRAHSSSVGIATTGPPSQSSPERRQMRLRNSAVRRRADAGSTYPQGRIEGAGRFLRGSAAARDAPHGEPFGRKQARGSGARRAPQPPAKSQRAGPSGWGWGRGVSWWRVLAPAHSSRRRKVRI